MKAGDRKANNKEISHKTHKQYWSKKEHHAAASIKLLHLFCNYNTVTLGFLLRYVWTTSNTCAGSGIGQGGQTFYFSIVLLLERFEVLEKLSHLFHKPIMVHNLKVYPGLLLNLCKEVQ